MWPRDSFKSLLKLFLACLLMLAAWTALAFADDGLLPVDRLRVPQNSVQRVFPPSSPLVSMPVAEFDSLLEAASSALRENRAGLPRILRSKHVVTAAGTTLEGVSTFEIEPHPSKLSPLPLSPWSPALSGPLTLDPDANLRSTDDGNLSLWLEPGPTRGIQIPWKQTARQDTDGKFYQLRLPETDLATIDLDVPATTSLSARSEAWKGPFPSADGHRRQYRYRGPIGPAPIELKLFDKALDPPLPPLWVGGATRVNVRDAGATWEASWSVDPGDGLLTPLQLDLDPSLDIVTVSGPAVDSFAITDLTAGSHRLTVHFLDTREGPTNIVIRGLASVPGEGAWKVPGVRLNGAAWVGGMTLVRVEPSRVLESDQPFAGIPAQISGELEPESFSSNGSSPVQLSYIATDPGSPAALTFRRPASSSHAEVRGQILLGPRTPRLEAAVTWTFDRLRPFELNLDLPPLWSPEQVTLGSVSEAISWQTEPRVGGGVRVVIPVPPTLNVSEPLIVSLSAALIDPSTPLNLKPLALPRILPVDTRVSDERWVAWSEPGFSLRPLDLKGLAWIEPASVGLEPPASAETGLAWRWNTPEATGSFLVEPRALSPRARIIEIFEVAPESRNLSIRVELDLGETTIRSLPLGWKGPGSPPITWRIEGVNNDNDGPTLQASEQTPELMAGPDSTSWFSLHLPAPRKGRLVLTARHQAPWSGSDYLPILTLPETFQSRCTILLGIDSSTRSFLTVKGLRTLDPALTLTRLRASIGEENSSSETRPAASALRWAHALGYEVGDQPSSLRLDTTPLSLANSQGVIREASITTPLISKGDQPYRLSLQVIPFNARTLTFQLPASSTLKRALVDGQPVSPSMGPDGLSLPIPSTSPSRPSCSVILEYDVASRGSTSSKTTLRSEPPRFSMPCLAMTWQVSSAGTPQILVRSPGLVDARPDDQRPWYRRLLGPSWTSWVRRPPVLTDDQQLELSQKAPTIGQDGISLGDLLLQWDGGRWPLVVDRPALTAAGWSPRNRLLTSQQEADSEITKKPNEALTAVGLTLLPFDDVLLLTTVEAQPNPSEFALYFEPWKAAIHRALRFGADDKKRFFSASHWVSTELPETLTGPESSGSPGTSVDHRPRWLHAVGWPALEVVVRPRAEYILPAVAWASALATFAFLLALTRYQTSFKLRVLVLMLALIGFALVRGQAGFMPYATGVLLGAMAALGFWLGSFPRRRTLPPASAVGSTVLRPGSFTGVEVALLLAVFLGLSWLTTNARARVQEASPANEDRILAVLPVQGDEEPAQVWIRKEDDDRLRRLATFSRPSTPQQKRPWAEEVRHRLDRLPEGTLQITSLFHLWSDSETPVPWNLPIGATKQLEARLDEQQVPLELSATGASARVWINRPGQHILVYRRLLDLRATRNDSSGTLPLNPLPQARLEGAFLPDLQINSSRALAPLAPQDPGWIGPVEFLSFSPRVINGETPAPVGTVESLMLWDAEPAGDRIRVRSIYRGAGPRAELRVALSPDALVRSARADGLIDSEVVSTADGSSHWIGRFDTPVLEGATVELDLWRPLGRLEAAADRQPRLLPLIRPLNVAATSGTLVLRKPVGWYADTRVGADRELQLPPDLPDGWSYSSAPLPMELFDVLPLEEPLGLSLDLVPASPRVTVLPEVEITILRGRLDVLAVAQVRALTRPYRQLDVAFPANWQPIEIVGEGLSYWDQQAPGKVRLRFDGPDQPSRLIRLRGWVPIATDPISTGVQSHDVPLPWPSWGRARAETGLMTINPGREKTARVVGAEGLLSPLPADPLVAASVVESAPLKYQVDRNESSARLQWSSDSARTQVDVRGLLTLYPTEAVWTASVRYKVAGAPLESLILSLPDEWASNARLEMPGVDAQISRESRDGQTFWTLKTDQPLWGDRQVVVRSKRPYDSSGRVPVPDLLPRGRGEATTVLMIANASGRRIVTEGSGAQPVDPRRLAGDADLQPPGDLPVEGYTVVNDQWRLSVRLDEAIDASRDESERTRVELTDMSLTRGADGSFWGQAQYHLGPRPGAFLSVSLPDSVEPLGAMVDGRVGRVLKSEEASVLIPLGAEGARQVTLLWRGPKAVVPLPRCARPSAAVLSFYVEGGQGPRLVGQSFEAVGFERVLLARLEQSARRIEEDLSLLDRSSARQQGALVGSLARFEVDCRAARRSAVLAAGDSEVATRVEALRSEVRQSLELSGLGGYLASARARVGLGGEDPLAKVVEPAVLPPALRIRMTGEPRSFQIAALECEEPVTVEWNIQKTYYMNISLINWRRLIIGLLVLAPGMLLAGWVSRAGLVGRWVGIFGLVGLLAAAPVAGFAGLAGLAAGWLFGRDG